MTMTKETVDDIRFAINKSKAAELERMERAAKTSMIYAQITRFLSFSAVAFAIGYASARDVATGHQWWLAPTRFTVAYALCFAIGLVLEKLKRK